MALASCASSPSSSSNSIIASTTSVTFPDTAVGGTAAATVTLSTAVDATIGIADSDTADFPYSTTCTVSMPAGSSCTIAVQFHPAIAGALSAWITVNSSIGKTAVQLLGNATGGSGGAVASSIDLLEITTSLPNPFYLAVGQTAQMAVTAVQTGAGGQDVTTIATWSTSDGSVATVSPGGLVTAIASGTASIQATYQGHLASIRALVAGVMTISPATMTFPPTAVGQSATATFTLTFTGPNQLASISTSNPMEFSVSATSCDETNAHVAGYTCPVGITFTPASTGSRSAQVAVTSAVAAGTGSTLTLSGAGN